MKFLALASCLVAASASYVVKTYRAAPAAAPTLVYRAPIARRATVAVPTYNRRRRYGAQRPYSAARYNIAPRSVVTFRLEEIREEEDKEVEEMKVEIPVEIKEVEEEKKEESMYEEVVLLEPVDEAFSPVFEGPAARRKKQKVIALAADEEEFYDCDEVCDNTENCEESVCVADRYGDGFCSNVFFVGRTPRSDYCDWFAGDSCAELEPVPCAIEDEIVEVKKVKSGKKKVAVTVKKVKTRMAPRKRAQVAYDSEGLDFEYESLVYAPSNEEFVFVQVVEEATPAALAPTAQQTYALLLESAPIVPQQSAQLALRVVEPRASQTQQVLKVAPTVYLGSSIAKEAAMKRADDKKYRLVAQVAREQPKLKTMYLKPSLKSVANKVVATLALAPRRANARRQAAAPTQRYVATAIMKRVAPQGTSGNNRRKFTLAIPVTYGNNYSPRTYAPRQHISSRNAGGNYNGVATYRCTRASGSGCPFGF